MSSRLDWMWRWFIVTRLYTKGWGNPDDIKRIILLRKKLGYQNGARHIIPLDYPVYIDKEIKVSGYRLLEGHFKSPVNDHCPGIMAKEVEIARFQMMLPHEWKTSLRPICVHMGGTGDHGFGRRRRLIGQPLLKEEGIASLILENPFYGCRKPKSQFRSSLQHVSDLFVMGAGLIMEGNILFNWLDRQGYGPIGATGISMGGHMASLAATSWHKPLSLATCMSGSTGAGTFTHGVLSTAIPWKVLEEQYRETAALSGDIKGLIQSPEPYWNNGEDSMYREGQKYYHELDQAEADSTKPDSGKHEPENTASTNSASGVESVRSVDTKCSDIGVEKTSKASTGVDRSSSLNVGSKSSDSSKVETSSRTIGSSSSSQQVESSQMDIQSKHGDFIGGSAKTFVDLNSTEDGAQKTKKENENAVNQSESCDKSTSAESISNKSDKKQTASDETYSSSIYNWMGSVTNSLPAMFLSSKDGDNEADKVRQQLERDCKHFMRGVMDECTHLGNYAVPVDPELIVIVIAEDDAYIPHRGYIKLHDLWPGSQMRTLQCGHIAGFIDSRNRKEFINAIADSFEIHAQKYYNTNIREISK